MADKVFEELDQACIDEMASSIKIPPRPGVLLDLQKEFQKSDPDPQVIAEIASRDVAICAAVLKVVNSPLYGNRRNIDSMSQAAMVLGLRQIATLITGLIARKAIAAEGPSMARFWDVSAKRAFSVRFLSRKLRIGEADVAQTFGLFCDLGIPLLMKKFPTYLNTLAIANSSADKSFVEVEQSQHQTDHALVGAIMSKTWGLSPAISMAIRIHHEYDQLGNPRVPDQVRDLVALGLLAEKIIQTLTGQNKTLEWARGGEAALRQLSISAYELDELSEDLRDALSNDT